jgi:hypothetical protein
MFNISDYLGKFKNLGQSEKQLKETVSGVIKGVIGVDILPDAIYIKGGVATIKTTPGTKGAVFIKKAEILQKIKEKTTSILIDLR